MKKLVCILILTISWLISNGQLYPPIQPYQENDYSLDQVKSFAMASTELSSSWRKELLEIVNNGLAEAGENMVLGESNISWILDHVVYERRSLSYFTNSRRIGNKVNFFLDKSSFDGMVGVFKYGKCNLIIYKTKCMNLLKISVVVVNQFPPQINPEPKPDNGFRKTNVDELDYTSSIIIKKVPEEYINPNNMFVTETIRTKTWFGRHWGWFAGVFVASGLTVGGIRLHNNHHHHDDGGPGGAPKTPPVITPPPVIIPPVVVPGGPGGAPKTP